MIELIKPHQFWPHAAHSIWKEEKRLIRLLLSGLRDKHKIPFVVGINLKKEGKILRPHGLLRGYPNLCVYLIKEVPGGKAKCNACTLKNMKACFDEAEDGSEPKALFEKQCHMGLTSFYYPLFIGGYKLGCHASGKIIVGEDSLRIVEAKIDELALVNNVSADIVQDLKKNARDISISKDAIKLARLKRTILKGMQSLNAVLTKQYHYRKGLFQSKIRQEARWELSSFKLSGPNLREHTKLKEILDWVRYYLGTNYLVFFLSSTPGGNMLELEVASGIEGVDKGGVHLNWNKAGFSEDSKSPFHYKEWDFWSQQDKIRGGIKGKEKSSLLNMEMLFPFGLAGYNGAIALGPFKRHFDQHKEREFLNVFCQVLGRSLAAMAVMQKLLKQEEEKNTGILLAAHMTRQGLQHIISEVAEINANSQPMKINRDAIDTHVHRTLFIIDELNRRVISALEAPQAVKAIIPDLQNAHLRLDMASTAIIISNCIVRHKAMVDKEKCRVTVDDDVESLPGIYCDADVLALAFDNLLENAIKYTGENKGVKIIGQVLRDQEKVSISFSNLGLEISKSELSQIFESGFRSEAAKKHLKESGHGLGLGQVKRILEIHGGSIAVENYREKPGDWGFRTTFTITLPTGVAKFLRI